MATTMDIAVASVMGAVNNRVKQVAITALQGVMQKSPVGNPSLWQSPAPPGYVGGHFRNNWQVGINSRPEGTLDGIDASGGRAISAGITEINSYRLGDMVHITNNLPYAQRLENGWSTQAPPQGIVYATWLELRHT